MKEKFAKLIEVKSLVTLALTAAMVGVMFSGTNIPQEGLTLFSASYGSIITYFFTRQDSK